MSLKEEIKEIVKEFRTIDFEGMTLDELATDKELNELTDKILALEPFQKLERVRESIQRFNESCDKAPNFVLAHNQIRKILNCELDNILSENEKAEG